MARYLTLLAVIVPFLAFAYGIVHPESKLYFSIPLTPTAAVAPAPAAAANATAPAATNATATNTTSTAATQLNFIPLGQFLGSLLTGLFGTGGTSLGSIIGNILAGIFGSGFTAAG